MLVIEYAPEENEYNKSFLYCRSINWYIWLCFNTFSTPEDYEKVRIYIKPKENKDEESKNSKSLDELLNEDENLYEEDYDEIEAALDWVFEGLSLWLK